MKYKIISKFLLFKIFYIKNYSIVIVILNFWITFRQQVEVLKREILDQEREYKNQISLLETKAHEQWVWIF